MDLGKNDLLKWRARREDGKKWAIILWLEEVTFFMLI